MNNGPGLQNVSSLPQKRDDNLKRHLEELLKVRTECCNSGRARVLPGRLKGQFSGVRGTPQGVYRGSMVVLWIVAQTAVADKGTSHIPMLENLSFGYQFWLPPQNFVAKSYDLVG